MQKVRIVSDDTVGIDKCAIIVGKSDMVLESEDTQIFNVALSKQVDKEDSYLDVFENDKILRG